jgi:uncharacterized OB-fold protein
LQEAFWNELQTIYDMRCTQMRERAMEFHGSGGTMNSLTVAGGSVAFGKFRPTEPSTVAAIELAKTASISLMTSLAECKDITQKEIDKVKTMYPRFLQCAEGS